MSAPSCPDRQTLYEYSVGGLSELKSAELEQHLDTCPHCHATVLQLDDATDPVVRAVRWHGEPDPFETEAGVLRALELSLDLRAPAGGFAAPAPRQQSGVVELRDYQLVAKLGEGGMGTVYKAIHRKLDKAFAVKVLRARSDVDPQLLARFRREMKAVGRLDHPNIVRATDAGEAGGIHYLAMELVDGVDLARLVEHTGRLSVADACETIRQAACGLEHAYQHGLVHRDLKPANLMLTREGRVKILDLGVALVDCDVRDTPGLTERHQVIGTVDYMAPEQFHDMHAVDIRADIYSLGCTLYFLLTGRPPYSGPPNWTALEKLHAHAHAPVPDVGDERPDIPESLSQILKRMMAKRAGDRFATPSELIQALAPFVSNSDLRGLANHYCPAVGLAAGTGLQPAARDQQPAAAASPGGRIGWRTKVAILLSAAATVFLGAIIYLCTGEGVLKLQINQDDVQVLIDGQEVVIRSPRDEYTLSAGKHLMQVTKDGFTSHAQDFRIFRNGVVQIEARLEPLAPAPAGPTIAAAGPLAPKEVRRFVGHVGDVLSIDVSPAGDRLASGGADEVVRVWDVGTGWPLHEIRRHSRDVRAVKFSPDGSRLLSAGCDLSIRLWDVQSGRQLCQFTGHEDEVACLDFAPDGAHFVSVSWDRFAILWRFDLATPERRFGYRSTDSLPVLRGFEDLAHLEGHVTWVRSVACAPNGKRFVTGGNEALVAEWDLETGKIRRRFIAHTAPVTSVTLTPGGDKLVTSGFDNTIRVWDFASGELERTIAHQTGPVLCLDISSDGQRIATGSSDATVRVYQLEDGRELAHFDGHQSDVLSVQFSPVGEHLFSASADATIRMWRLGKNE